MTVTEFDLKLANFVQDKGSIDFETCTSLYGKSESTLKRNIYTLNEYLPEDLHFSISDRHIQTNMTYADFSKLCDEITLNHYTTSIDERVMLVICYAFFEGVLNTTELYTKLNLSLSTKKKDRKELGKMLRNKNIQVINRHRKGIELVGNERFLRMYVARQLISVIELNENDAFIQRKANTPIQKLLYRKFEEYLAVYHDEVTEELEKLFKKTETSVDYASKKFIYIHTALSLLRIKQGYQIQETLENMPEVPHYNMLPVKTDSRYLDYLIVSLNYKESLNFPKNEAIARMTNHLIHTIEEEMAVQFYVQDEIYKEIYAFLYKCQIKNKLDYFFYDDKLDNTAKEFPALFKVIQASMKQYDKQYQFSLTEEQISVICLIVETYIMKNHLITDDKPRIIIITNSSVEKVNFFLESLKHYVDFKMVSYLTINELYKLKSLEFDFILTFSNRITVLLKELGWESIKLNFYLNTEDFKKLIDQGFPSNRNRKFSAEDFVEKLASRESKTEKVDFLRSNYSEYFL
jgi:transcriptional antiterminator